MAQLWRNGGSKKSLIGTLNPLNIVPQKTYPYFEEAFLDNLKGRRKLFMWSKRSFKEITELLHTPVPLLERRHKKPLGRIEKCSTE